MHLVTKQSIPYTSTKHIQSPLNSLQKTVRESFTEVIESHCTGNQLLILYINMSQFYYIWLSEQYTQ